MKTPVWVWDKKQEIYLRLPTGIKQFEDGKWGYDAIDYIVISDDSISKFYGNHNYLFKFVADKRTALGWRLVLRSTKPQDKHWYNKVKARITKVQR